MTRVRQFRLGGKSTPFKMYGYGWNKGKISEVADVIRNYGYYARVIPTYYDKDLRARKYAIFIRPKWPVGRMPQALEWGPANPRWWTSQKKVKFQKGFPVRVDHTRFGQSNEYSEERLLQSASDRNTTMLFNRSEDDVKWDTAIADGDYTIADKAAAKTLGMTFDQFEQMEMYGQSEAANYDERRGVDPFEKERWWEDDFWKNPLEQAGNVDLLESKAEQFEDTTKMLRKRRRGKKTVAKILTEEDEERPDFDLPDEEFEERYGESKEDWWTYNDPYTQLMDSIGYNDSAYGGISPMVLMGYGGSGGRIIGEEEYEEFLNLAEQHRNNTQRQADLFFQGNGRFGEFKEFAKDLGIPTSKEIIALPLITIKYNDGDGGFGTGRHFGVNEVGQWYLHPAVKATLDDAKYGTFDKQGNMYAAEMAMLEHIFAGGYGSRVFTENVLGDYNIEEDIDNSILNAQDWFDTRTQEIPEIMVVGSDIGFFDQNGNAKGIRLTPRIDEEEEWDDVTTESYPVFMRSLFKDNEEWAQIATSQVYWRGQRIYGPSNPLSGASRSKSKNLRDFSEQWDDLQIIENDLMYELSPAEIDLIYNGDVMNITKSEAIDFLALIEKGTKNGEYIGEQAGGPDDRLMRWINGNEKPIQKIRDRATMTRNAWAKKYDLEGDWDYNRMPEDPLDREGIK